MSSLKARPVFKLGRRFKPTPCCRACWTCYRRWAQIKASSSAHVWRRNAQSIGISALDKPEADRSAGAIVKWGARPSRSFKSVSRRLSFSPQKSASSGLKVLLAKAVSRLQHPSIDLKARDDHPSLLSGAFQGPVYHWNSKRMNRKPPFTGTGVSNERWFLCALAWAMVAATNSVAEP